MPQFSKYKSTLSLMKGTENQLPFMSRADKVAWFDRYFELRVQEIGEAKTMEECQAMINHIERTQSSDGPTTHH